MANTKFKNKTFYNAELLTEWVNEKYEEISKIISINIDYNGVFIIFYWGTAE